MDSTENGFNVLKVVAFSDSGSIHSAPRSQHTRSQHPRLQHPLPRRPEPTRMRHAANSLPTSLTSRAGETKSRDCEITAADKIPLHPHTNQPPANNMPATHNLLAFSKLPPARCRINSRANATRRRPLHFQMECSPARRTSRILLGMSTEQLHLRIPSLPMRS